jgi:HK97 family phage prohead protease
MPYFVTDQADDCSGWATVKDDGEVIGCHATKADAIAQMVAVSLAEGLEPGGERALPDNYRPALAADVPDGRACGNCDFYDEDRIQGDRAWCERWDDFVRGDYYCNAWQRDVEDDEDDHHVEDDEPEQLGIRAEVPAYMARAAQRGLDLRADGFGGDGLTEQTIREARLIARGQMSDAKVIRANAWAARHAVDLQASQNSDPDDPRWPGAGAVAHYLWGIDPLDPQPARAWLARTAESLQERTMPSKVEKRSITIDDFELRQAGDGMSFTGYAAVFNSPSQPLPFIETIAPGAFKRSLSARNNVRMLLNHDTSRVLGTTRAKTLRLSEDSKGLHVEADLPETTYGRDLSVSMQRGDVDSMSFGFSVPRNGDKWTDDGNQRTLVEVRLHEVSVVTFPAYEATTASVRDYSALALRAEADEDAIAEAMEALVDGSLTEQQADLLRAVVDKAAPQVQPTGTPVSVLQKQLDLIAKSI